MHTKYSILHAKKNYFEKCLFAYEIRFAVDKKTKKFLGQIFKIFKIKVKIVQSNKNLKIISETLELEIVFLR